MLARGKDFLAVRGCFRGILPPVVALGALPPTLGLGALAATGTPGGLGGTFAAPPPLPPDRLDVSARTMLDVWVRKPEEVELPLLESEAVSEEAPTAGAIVSLPESSTAEAPASPLRRRIFLPAVLPILLRAAALFPADPWALPA